MSRRTLNNGQRRPCGFPPAASGGASHVDIVRHHPGEPVVDLTGNLHFRLDARERLHPWFATPLPPRERKFRASVSTIARRETHTLPANLRDSEQFTNVLTKTPRGGTLGS